MKKRRSITFGNLLILLLLTAGCNMGGNKEAITDTVQAHSGIDSMPVVKPLIKDSSAIITTPPVNDDNVIVPDTNNRSK